MTVQVLRDFRDNVVTIAWDTVTDCDMMGEDGGPAYTWSLPGAILFSVTVFTTIGQCVGHVPIVLCFRWSS